LRQKRCCCRWWKVWPSSNFKNCSNNWKSDMWWEKTTESPEELNTKKVWATNCTKNTGSEQNMRKEIYLDISARWLKIHNIFIGTSWWNIKLYSTEHNIINLNSRSRYIMQCTHTHKCQKDQELRHTLLQDKAVCNTMRALKSTADNLFDVRENTYKIISRMWPELSKIQFIYEP
jgi:hypothetical protein